ncbi:uncharacterized protein F5147DRAFT_648196 [Suillus discolor]|uniref:Uncharacterized protein n=1 Tax=Suillus discolor TaxID=1912936 RepID=A0A9P7FKS8_9AGAM|nr:uncharacterized protein F5147DRAFT_648196 [Suillus discolor]KAG2119145.1 hypothetical protein F5147DRAFT_648196 [Suillus discolor]
MHQEIPDKIATVYGSLIKTRPARQLGPATLTALLERPLPSTEATLTRKHSPYAAHALQGAPFHPKSFAYGRLEHFKYLAMQLLGMDVDEVRARNPLPAVVNTLVVADQMSRVPLISYGIGTLEYVSLNMHYDIRLAPRDDIESLGYMLLSLAVGDLPWTYNTRHGTSKNQEVQFWIKKHLKFDQLPDYQLLRLQIQETFAPAGLLDSATIEWNIPAEALSDTIPLCPGQVVCCQIDIRTTLEGYSARVGDPLFWRDPGLSPEKWNTAAVCPATVLWVGIDNQSELQSIVVVCIGQGVSLPLT